MAGDGADPATALARRLAAIQEQIRVALDRASLARCAPSACARARDVTDADVERTVGYCRQLCARDGTVVWTRGRWAPDLLPQICDWFAGRGFDELWVSDPAEGWGAAAHRFTGTPDPLEEGAHMFTFRGHHPRTGPARSFLSERTVVYRPSPGQPETRRGARSMSSARSSSGRPRRHPGGSGRWLGTGT